MRLTALQLTKVTSLVLRLTERGRGRGGGGQGLGLGSSTPQDRLAADGLVRRLDSLRAITTRVGLAASEVSGLD